MTHPSLFDQSASHFGQQPLPGGALPSERSQGFVSSVWRFEGRAASPIYRWYGTLPTELVDRVLRLFSVPAGRFADAFLGQSPSVIQATHYGMDAVGFDVSPIAVMIARLRLLGPVSDREVSLLVGRVARRFTTRRPGARSPFLQSEAFAYARKWFAAPDLALFSDLLRAISEERRPQRQLAGLVAASQIVRDVAHVDSRCTHHLVTKVKPRVEGADLLSKWAVALAGVATALRDPSGPTQDVAVLQRGFTHSALPDRSIDLLLAHPPYLGVIHYNQIHRLSTDLFAALAEERPIASLRNLNFSHSSIKEADASTDNGAHYQVFIDEFARECARTVADGGRCVLIVGDQRHRGLLRHPETSFIVAMTDAGFSLEERFVWLLENNSGMHVKRRGHHIDHNYIVVFKKSQRAD